MQVGMLWRSDNKKLTFLEKAAEAIAYYTQKYGVVPDNVYVNPGIPDLPVHMEVRDALRYPVMNEVVKFRS